MRDSRWLGWKDGKAVVVLSSQQAADYAIRHRRIDSASPVTDRTAHIAQCLEALARA